jgi:cellulose synthase/poly-beta-1,6-N-acetylglucosamine synthase-like glycosyltransferase
VPELPSVSAIVPARDEEQNIARAVRSLDEQPEILEIIVVNDESTDRTGEVLAGMAAQMPKLKILETHELPPGWTGKNYAASLGAEGASGDWLLFTDADTEHRPGSTRRALADAAEHGAVLVSYSPEQELHSVWERALVPFVYCRLAEKYSFARVNDPENPDAAANGQYILVRRDVYEAIGGHGAVRNRVLEDVALARRVKQAGYGLHFASGTGIARTRMYRSFGAMWEGWTKNLYALMGGSASAVAWELESVFPWLELALLVLASFRSDPVFFSLAILGLTARHARYGVALRRNRFALSLIQYYVPGVLLYSAALVASAWKNTRGAVVWKGRQYRAGMP